jgi:cytochrome c5
MKSPANLNAIGALLVPAAATADTGEEVVKARCSLCHEGGAGGAPRIGNRSEWEPRAARGKLALYETALKGKPNTAMMARGGFRDLSNDEVMAAVEYMVAKAGLKPGLQPEPPPVAVAAALAPDADDKTVTAYVAEALRELAPGSKVEIQEETASVAGAGIRVTTREGVVWLRGTVRNAEFIERAEAIAQVASRGRKVENKLVSASIVESD